MKIVVASGNAHKIEEIKEILKDWEVISYKKDYPDHKSPVEDGDTLKENSYIKARDIKKLYDEFVIADDSGLFCDALGGEPGVHSARYAGEPCDDKKNSELLIENLKDKDKTARFISTICLIDKDNNQFYFEGECKGKIIDEARGENGFGYDPHFIPDGYDRTFAQMTAVEKNKISHRRKAVQKLKEFLNERTLS